MTPSAPPCAHHTVFECCTRCTSSTDGYGFPHRLEAKGKRRLQQCPKCDRWVDPDHWIQNFGHGFFGCLDCN